jgi:hypothetical protein
MPLIESGATDDLGKTTMTEQKWRTGIISQTLAETPDNSTLSSKCWDLHSRLVFILTHISDKQQALVDDVYAQVLAQIETSQAKQTS